MTFVACLGMNVFPCSLFSSILSGVYLSRNVLDSSENTQSYNKASERELLDNVQRSVSKFDGMLDKFNTSSNLDSSGDGQHPLNKDFLQRYPEFSDNPRTDDPSRSSTETPGAQSYAEQSNSLPDQYHNYSGFSPDVQTKLDTLLKDDLIKLGFPLEEDGDKPIHSEQLQNESRSFKISYGLPYDQLPRNDDGAYKDLTSLNVTEFKRLLPAFQRQYQGEQDRKAYQTNDLLSSLPRPEDRLLFILDHVKTKDTTLGAYGALAKRHSSSGEEGLKKISTQTAKKRSEDLLPILETTMQELDLTGISHNSSLWKLARQYGNPATLST